MEKIKPYVFFSCFMLILTMGSVTDSFVEAVKDVTLAMRSANAKKMSARFASSLSLSIKKGEDFLTKFQAEQVLADFFKKHKIKGLVENQRVNSASNSFLVFTIETEHVTHRVFIRFMYEKKEYKISELRIE